MILQSKGKGGFLDSFTTSSTQDDLNRDSEVFIVSEEEKDIAYLNISSSSAPETTSASEDNTTPREERRLIIPSEILVTVMRESTPEDEGWQEAISRNRSSVSNSRRLGPKVLNGVKASNGIGINGQQHRHVPPRDRERVLGPLRRKSTANAPASSLQVEQVKKGNKTPANGKVLSPTTSSVTLPPDSPAPKPSASSKVHPVASPPASAENVEVPKSGLPLEEAGGFVTVEATGAPLKSSGGLTPPPTTLVFGSRLTPSYKDVALAPPGTVMTFPKLSDVAHVEVKRIDGKLVEVPPKPYEAKVGEVKQAEEKQAGDSTPAEPRQVEAKPTQAKEAVKAEETIPLDTKSVEVKVAGMQMEAKSAEVKGRAENAVVVDATPVGHVPVPALKQDDKTVAGEDDGNSVEGKALEVKPAGGKAPVSKFTDTRSRDSKASEPRQGDRRQEVRGVDRSRVYDRKLPDLKARDRKVLNGKFVERKSQDVKVAERKLPDQKAAERKYSNGSHVREGKVTIPTGPEQKLVQEGKVVAEKAEDVCKPSTAEHTRILDGEPVSCPASDSVGAVQEATSKAKAVDETDVFGKAGKEGKTVLSWADECMLADEEAEQIRKNTSDAPAESSGVCDADASVFEDPAVVYVQEAAAEGVEERRVVQGLESEGERVGASERIEGEQQEVNNGSVDTTEEVELGTEAAEAPRTLSATAPSFMPTCPRVTVGTVAVTPFKDGKMPAIPALIPVRPTVAPAVTTCAVTPMRRSVPAQQMNLRGSSEERNGPSGLSIPLASSPPLRSPLNPNAAEFIPMHRQVGWHGPQVQLTGTTPGAPQEACDVSEERVDSSSRSEDEAVQFTTSDAGVTDAVRDGEDEVASTVSEVVPAAGLSGVETEAHQLQTGTGGDEERKVHGDTEPGATESHDISTDEKSTTAGEDEVASTALSNESSSADEEERKVERVHPVEGESQVDRTPDVTYRTSSESLKPFRQQIPCM